MAAIIRIWVHLGNRKMLGGEKFLLAGAMRATTGLCGGWREGLSALLLTACATVPVLSRAGTLERVVIVERHGVRAPSKTPEKLSAYSAQAWPAWPVAPGDLTPHGAAALRLMGAWLRGNYAREGLLPAAGCPEAGSVFVWADGRDRRTIESGDAVLGGLAPGCGLSAQHGAPDVLDPIFDGVAAGACPLDSDAARQSVVSAMAGGLAAPVPGYAASMAALRDLLDPPALRKVCGGGEKRCFEDGSNSVSVSDRDVRIEGPLATASTLTEALTLEYEEGFSGGQLGWGRLDQTMLGQVIGLHNGYSRLTRGNAEIAGRNGARVAGAVIAALAGKAAFPGQGQPARLSIVLGHDTTIWNLAGMLGMSWTLPGQPDETPPDGAIVFEVYGGATAADRVVRVSMLYQTADQLRNLEKLDDRMAPGRVAVGGAGGGKGWTAKALRAAFSRSVPVACGRP